jgi:hypothetical protein
MSIWTNQAYKIQNQVFFKIFSLIYDSVTNNSGFCTGWLDLLTTSFTITRNHNQLQELTINLQPNPSFLTAEDPLHSHFRSTTDSFVLRCTQSQSQSQSCDTTGGFPPISSSWRQAPRDSRQVILFSK